MPIPWRLTTALLIVSALLTGCIDRDRNRATVMKNEAILLYEGGNYTGALRRLAEAVTTDPTYGEAYYLAGMIRLQAFESPETAVPDLERAIELLPDDARPRYQLGRAYLQDGNYELALEHLAGAVERDETHARALFRLGVAQEATGAIMEAVESYSRSIRSDPAFPQPYEGLGNIYGRYDAVDEAITVFSEGVRLTSQANMANNLGRMYQRKGEIEAAIQSFEQAVQGVPDSVFYVYNLGVAYDAAFSRSRDPQDRERARQHLTSAADRCGSLGSRARCNEIRDMLEQLDESEAP